MEITVPVTQLRTGISALLKRLREDPRVVFKIKHHREIVAELRAPDLAGRPAPADEDDITDFINAYLSGGISQKKGAYRQIRQLCGAGGSLPYRTVEEAMEAVRGRDVWS